MTPTTATVVLATATVVTSMTTENVIDSLQGTVDSCHLSQEFIGIILLPIIGNAAEHYTAVTTAVYNKMDLSPFQLLVLIFSVLIVMSILSNGQTNWLEGVMLLLAYIIICFIYFL